MAQPSERISDLDPGAPPFPAGTLVEVSVPTGIAERPYETYSASLSDLPVLSGDILRVVPLTGQTLNSPAGLGGYVIDPAGDLATLHIVLPPTPTNRQVFEISTTQTIGVLTVTVTSNGVLVLGAGGGASFRYLASEGAWFRRY